MPRSPTVLRYALQKPFRTEAPLLMEIFQQVFKSITAAELAEACEPVVQPRNQHRRGAAARPQGSGMLLAVFLPIIDSLDWCVNTATAVNQWFKAHKQPRRGAAS